jgi:hypothetical protein
MLLHSVSKARSNIDTRAYSSLVDRSIYPFALDNISSYNPATCNLIA